MRTGMLAGCAVLLIASFVLAGEAGLQAAHGVVEKADRETLLVQTRGGDGRFGKKVLLKVTGTSKVSSVSMEKRGGKTVPVQRDIEVSDLEEGQPIAVVYIAGAEPTLLSGLVEKRGSKK